MRKQVRAGGDKTEVAREISGNRDITVKTRKKIEFRGGGRVRGRQEARQEGKRSVWG